VLKPQVAVLKTLYMDWETYRTRDKKPDEPSVYDDFLSGKRKIVWAEIPSRSKWGSMTDEEKLNVRDEVIENQTPPGFAYTEADALEDAILFPEELDHTSASRAHFKELSNPLTVRSERLPLE
jgi:hypothetical protein